MSFDLRPAPQTRQGDGAQGRGGALAWLQLAVLVALLAGVAILLWRSAEPTAGPAAPLSGRAAQVRLVAAKLKAAGADHQAALLYGEYLETPGLAATDRAAIAFSLAETQLEQGQYQAALRWYYVAQIQLKELTAAGQGNASLHEEVNRKVVHALERLGRTHAARQALKASVSLGAGQAIGAGAVADAIVAEVGARTVYRSDVLRAYDELPERVKEQLGHRLPEFAKQYVAEHLLRRKAEKLGYDRDAEVLRQLDGVRRRLMVSKFIQQEVVAQQRVEPADVANYFAANRARYDTPAAIQVRVAVVDDKTLADRLLKAGAATFEAGVAKYSRHPSKAQGGQLPGWFSSRRPVVEGLKPADQRRLLAAAPGALLQAPVAGGWLVALISDRRDAVARTMAEEAVSKRVHDDYLQYKTQAAYMQMVETELRSPDVKLHLDVLEDE